MKKFLSLVLSIALVMTLCCSLSLAEAKDQPIYVALGDSITYGFSLPGFDIMDAFNMNPMNNKIPETAYPSLVGNQLNYKTYNLAVSGFDSGNLLNTLNGVDVLQDDENTFWLKRTADVIRADGYSFVDHFLDTENYETAWALKNADIISVFIGYNDVLSRLAEQALETEAFKGMDPLMLLFGSQVPEEYRSLFGNNTIDIQKVLGSSEEILQIFTQKNLRNLMNEAKSAIKSRYEKILKRIEQINPNAKILVVGYFNAYNESLFDYQTLRNSVQSVFQILRKMRQTGIKQLSINDFEALIYRTVSTSMRLPMQSSFEELNAFLQSLCNKSARRTYVSITDLPVEETIDPHPGEAGHTYIAEQILEVLASEVTLTNTEYLGKTTTVSLTNAEQVQQNTWKVKAGENTELTITSANPSAVKSIQVNGTVLLPREDGSYILNTTAGTNYTVKLNYTHLPILISKLKRFFSF